MKHAYRARTSLLMSDVQQLVQVFIDALRKGDVQKAVSFFTPRGIYHEAGATPFVGHAAIADCLRSFVALDRPWNFVIDDVVYAECDQKAAVVYRFLIEGGDGEQLERAGCALIKLSGEQFAEWREYTG